MDRLCELTNIGAGHAATAFSKLAGREIQMSVPRLCVPQPEHSARVGVGQSHWPAPAPPERSCDWDTGVFFEFQGGMDGLVGILFRDRMRECLVSSLLGESAGPYSAQRVESALMEVGNIVVSQVASAIADMVGARVLPSVPTLEMERASLTLGALARQRAGADPIRIECELTDDKGEIGGLLVVIPDS